MVEWAWTLTAALGLALAIWGRADAHRDLQALGGSVNGRRRVANGYMRAERIRGLIQGGWLVLGICALLDLPLWWASFVLIAGNVGMAINSAMDGWDRMYLRLTDAERDLPWRARWALMLRLLRDEWLPRRLRELFR